MVAFSFLGERAFRTRFFLNFSGRDARSPGKLPPHRCIILFAVAAFERGFVNDGAVAWAGGEEVFRDLAAMAFRDNPQAR